MLDTEISQGRIVTEHRIVNLNPLVNFYTLEIKIVQKVYLGFV